MAIFAFLVPLMSWQACTVAAVPFDSSRRQGDRAEVGGPASFGAV